MNTSLIFLSDSDRALVWKAIDAGVIPYPVNGMVPTLFLDRALGRVNPESHPRGIPEDCIVPLPKPAAPATEYRRWKCSTRDCETNKPLTIGPTMAKDSMALGYQIGCGLCTGGTRTVIACDKDGREIVAATGKRWFKQVEGYTTWIRKFHGGKSFLNFVGAFSDWTPEGAMFTPDNMEGLGFDEITESEALALLEPKR